MFFFLFKINQTIIKPDMLEINVSGLQTTKKLVLVMTLIFDHNWTVQTKFYAIIHFLNMTTDWTLCNSQWP